MSKRMQDDILKVLLTEEQIRDRVKELGREISRDYAGKEPILVAILRGSVVFAADLARQVEGYCRMDFMVVSSYGSGTTSSGEVKIVKDLADPIEGRDVLVVEDILDSGHTLHRLLPLLRDRKPASLRLCTLLDKPERRDKDTPVHVDYVGFVIPDAFVVGYGLDYDERYRNLPYIGVLKPEVYEN